MIARYKKQQLVNKDSSEKREATLGGALGLLRYATQATTVSLSPLLKLQQTYETLAWQPSQQQLDKDVVQQVHKSWKDRVSNDPGVLGNIAADKYSKLGPFQQILRVYRDLKNSTATRQDRILAALRQQAVKSWQNTQQISSISGLPVMHGVFI